MKGAFVQKVAVGIIFDIHMVVAKKLRTISYLRTIRQQNRPGLKVFLKMTGVIFWPIEHFRTPFYLV
jgi:hypothetical protein